MKTSADPRHRKRQGIVKELFAYSFSGLQKLKLSTKVAEKIETIDKYISQSAPAFPIEKLNKIDLAILRLAVFELIIEKSEPPKVVIDEAVELAKEFGSDNSSKFVNGVLGTILKDK